MRRHILFGARGRRGLVTSLLIGIGALILAMPVGAAGSEPPFTSTTLTMNNDACTVAVTYTWAGFKGGGFSAVLALVEGTGSDWGHETIHQTGRRGSVSYVFVLSKGGSFSVRAALLKRGVPVSGSLRDSEIKTLTCDNPTP